jgi:hypothetical protein
MFDSLALSRSAAKMSTPVKSDNVMLNADGKPIPQPTLPEAYFMLNVIKFINGKLDTDWTKVAEAQGLKNAETAKVRIIYPVPGA